MVYFDNGFEFLPTCVAALSCIFAILSLNEVWKITSALAFWSINKVPVGTISSIVE